MSFKSTSCKKTNLGTSLENRKKTHIDENIVTRISRISTPRATLGAFALLVIVMAGFGMFADGREGPTTRDAHLANEVVEQPATEASQHCWTSTRVPFVAIEGRRENNHDVQL